MAQLPLVAQDSAAEFKQARESVRRFSGKVLNDQVRLNWTGPDSAWYARELAGGGREFIRVDAVRGVREPAFDHAALASALSRELKIKGLDPARLDLRSLEFRPDSSITFRHAAQKWEWQPSSKTLRGLPPGPEANGLKPLSQLPRVSSGGGGETGVAILNKTSGPIEVFWLSTSGRRQSYGKVQPGEAYRAGSYEGHVWIVTDASGKTLGGFVAGAADEVPVTGPAADTSEPKQNSPEPARRRGGQREGTSPDGEWTAFLRDRNVWVRPAGGGEGFAVSDDGREGDSYEGPLLWSPDSRFLMAPRVKAGGSRTVTMVDSSPDDQVQPKVVTHNYLKPGDVLPITRPQIFEPAAKRRAGLDPSLYDNPWSINNYRWAPDSSELTFVYNQRGHQVLRVVGIDPVSGKTRAIVEDKTSTFIHYSAKFFLRHLDDTREIVWMSERDGWNHLYLFDAVTGALKRQITKGNWLVHQVDDFDEKTRNITFHLGGCYPSQDPYHVHYARVSLDTGVVTPLTDGDGTHEISYSPDKKWIVDKWSRVDLAPVTELRRASDGKKVCELEKADMSSLLAMGWRPPERFSAKGRDGKTDIWGYIVRPTGFDASKKYPVIENIYAGPHDAHVEKAFHTGGGHIRELAEAGFIVVRIDGMGTSLRSKAFHDVCWKNLKDAGFPDRIAWIKAAGATRPEMDLSRMGIYGGSAGGQNAMRAVLDHADFYKAAAADCGCHDNRMDKIWWNEQWMGWPVDDSFVKSSNVADAGKLGGRLLLTVGELDHNVDPASTTQVVDALIKANKDFEYLVLPGRDHGAGESDYGRRRRLDFFLRHLGKPAGRG